MRRRALIWLAGCGALTGAAWIWLRPSPVTLGVPGPAEIFGHAMPETAARTGTGPVLLEALARFAPETGRNRLRQLLDAGRADGDRVDFAFSPDRKTVASGRPAEAPGNLPLVLPSEAVLQSKGVGDCFLLIRFEPASGLLGAPARRRWMGGALADAVREARTATVAVGEETPPARTVATIVLEFTDGARAEAALKRLVAEDAVGPGMGFTATPGAAATSRVSGIVVIRIEAEARLVRATLER